MGKIVKFCASCEESFAEKFSFCPNCASGLTAYEMNPIVAEAKPTETVKIFEPTNEVPFETIDEPTVPLETMVFETEPEPETPIFLSQNTDDVLELEEEEFLKHQLPLLRQPLLRLRQVILRILNKLIKLKIISKLIKLKNIPMIHIQPKLNLFFTSLKRSIKKPMLPDFTTLPLLKKKMAEFVTLCFSVPPF